MSEHRDSDAPGPLGPGSRNIIIRPFAAAEWQLYRRLRLASLTDAPDSFGSTLAAEQDQADAHWKERLRSGVTSSHDLPLLALAEGEPVGLVWGKVDAANSSIVHVYQMWVTPTHRRLGIGAALLERLIEWARNRGASEVVLSVTCGDSPARRLYQRLGFDPDGESTPLRAGSTVMAQEMRHHIA